MAKTIRRGAQIGIIAGFILPLASGVSIANLVAPMIIGCGAGLAGGFISAKSRSYQPQEYYDCQSEMMGRF